MTNPTLEQVSAVEAVKALQPKQRKFVFYYVFGTQCRTRAAEEAGYGTTYMSSAVSSARLLKNPKVRKAVDQLFGMFMMPKTEVLGQLASAARDATLDPFMRDDGNGNVVIDLTTERAKANYRYLKKVKQKKRVITSEDGTTIEEYETEIEVHDRMQALRKLADLFADVTNVNVTQLILNYDELYQRNRDRPNVIEQRIKALGYKDGNGKNGSNGTNGHANS